MEVPNFAAMFGTPTSIPLPPGTNPPAGAAPWIYFPAGGGEGGTVSTPPGGISPSAVYRSEMDYSASIGALSKTGFAIGRAGREIGEYRTAKAIGEQAQKISRQKAYQKTQAGLKAASAARAIAGAQGRTGAGSPLLAELASVQSGVTDARNELYQGNIEKFNADQKAKKHLYGAGGDILEALLSGSSLFKEKY